MKKEFRSVNFRQKTLTMIEICNEIIEEYEEQGLRLTLRQLYYQCVSRDIIPNSEKSYKGLGGIVSDARLAGLMDWEAIEDRGRQPKVPPEFKNLDELARAAINTYRLPRWEGQDFYVELWVEKDALAGVLSPLAREFHVTLMVNRGYSSQSAMHESSKRFLDAVKEGKEISLFYLGDLDPSGEDMVRDIRDRMEMFGAADLDVQKLALTMEQVKKYKPPPNPAKVTDSRAKAYIEKYGEHSWEVDALPPNRLAEIIRGALSNVMDVEKMNAVKKREETDKKRLLQAVSQIMT